MTGARSSGSIAGAVVLLAVLAVLLAGCKLYPDWVYVSGARTGDGAAAPAAPPSERAIGPNRVRVEAGDTLYAIAREHRVPLRDLIAINGLAPPYRLIVGRVLTLPAVRVHIVERGDTVYAISRRYGVDMSALVRLNDIGPPYTIKIGQELRLPAQTRVVLLASADTPTTAASSGAVEVTTLAPPSASSAPAPVPTQAPGGPSEPLGAAESGEPAAAGPSVALTSEAFEILPPSPGAAFEWPARGPIISNFGTKPGNLHNDGINLALEKGTPVRAAREGVVAYAGNELKGYGNLVLLRHDDGWVSAYAHNESLLVSRGDPVKRGQVISLSGDTGGVDGPQLHFELRRDGIAVDPAQYLAKG
ncbi:MAG TPA: LysM peptidoglycan-binding domain-containing M23 family metallopeptidase [Alphaproteobacteria bacterium]|nr:LysM peptidoglycan-binding domain-containing M23 family metallopeptidase [Alphaproteobacteria bacterium]